MSLIDYFAVYGLEHLHYTNILPEPDFLLDKIEIITFYKPTQQPKNTRPYQWVDIDGKNINFLKCTYSRSTQNPITEIHLSKIQTIQNSIHLTIPNMEPVSYLILNSKDVEENIHFSSSKIIKENVETNIYSGNYDVSKLFSPNTNYGSSILGMFVIRNPKLIPIVDIMINVAEKNVRGENTLKLSEFTKYVPFKFGEGEEKSKLICFTLLNLFEKSFYPQLLDRYPSINRKGLEFPDPGNICFPEGVKLLSELPTPKFYFFVLTNGAGIRIYGANLIIFEEPSKQILDAISLYKEPFLKIIVPKSLCLLSKDSFCIAYKEILKQLYRMQISELNQPIEEIIFDFMERIPRIKSGIIEYVMGTKKIQFIKPVWQIPPFAEKENFEFLVSSLTYETTIKVVTAILLEKKILVISSRKALLGYCISAMTSLIFPFQWTSVLIPILPSSLVAILEAPVPFLIGIDTKIEKTLQNLPSDVIKVNLDNNVIIINEALSKIPENRYNKLTKRLKKIWIQNPLLIETSDEAYNVIQSNPDEDYELNYLEIKDAFLEFISKLLKNYRNYILYSQDDNPGRIEFSDIFNKAEFFSTVKSKTLSNFLDKLTQTSLFASFIESHQNITRSPMLQFFIENQTLKRNEKSQSVFSLSNLKKIIITCNIEKRLRDKEYRYLTFPKLNYAIFSNNIKHMKDTFLEETEFSLEPLKTPQKNCEKFSNYEWAICLLDTIFEIWYKLFLHSVPYYKKNVEEFLLYAKNVLSQIKIRYDIKNIDTITKYFIEAYDLLGLSEEKEKMFKELMSTESKLSQQEAINYYIRYSIGNRTSILHNESQVPSKKIKKIKNKLLLTIIEIDSVCSHCEKEMKGEDVIKALPRNINNYVIQCTFCFKNFSPHLKIIRNKKKPKIFHLLSPLLLQKEVTNMETNYGEHIFFKPEFFEKNHEIVFWNLNFYFRLLMLSNVMFDFSCTNLQENLIIPNYLKLKNIPHKILSFNQIDPAFSELKINEPENKNSPEIRIVRESANPNFQLNLNLNLEESKKIFSPEKEDKSIEIIFGPLLKELLLKNKEILSSFQNIHPNANVIYNNEEQIHKILMIEQIKSAAYIKEFKIEKKKTS